MPECEWLTRLANDEAAILGHDYVGTEHLLLALCGASGTVAASALADHAVEREPLRRMVNRMVQTAPSESSAARPWSPRAKRALKFAIEEARALSHDYVGPEHVLLGLLRVTEGVAVREVGADGVDQRVPRRRGGVAVHAVRALGADPSAIRRTVLEGLEEV